MQSADKSTNDTPAEGDQIQCVNCEHTFAWNQAYWQNRTPGSRDPAGYDYVSRAFCPHCGSIICEGSASAWEWYGDNRLLNASKELPPTLPPDLEWIPDDKWDEFIEDFHRKWGKRHLPKNLWVPFAQQRLDLSLVGTFEEIPLEPKKVHPLKAFLAKLSKYVLQLKRRKSKTSIEREAFFHEDDYCQIEVLPIANWNSCVSQLQEIQKFAAEHFDRTGWTDMRIRDENSQRIESLHINVKDLAAGLSRILTPYDRVLTGYSSFREQAEDTMAFGTETSCVVFVDYNSEGIVEDIWLDFKIVDQKSKELAFAGLQYLGSLGELLLVDWDLSKIINLSDQDEIMSYADLQEKLLSRLKSDT